MTSSLSSSSSSSSSSSCCWNLIHICGVVGVVCAGWNLIGDLFFLDFYRAFLSFEGDFGEIRTSTSSSSGSDAGYLFPTFNNNNNNNWQWLVFLAQSGGWMYPVWAFVTAVPLYMGFCNTTTTTTEVPINFWKTVAPCALLVYGLCVVGGALHSAFAFLTVLPGAYHNYNGAEEQPSWINDEDIVRFLQTAQSRIVQHILFGCFPGYVACNVASVWIAIEVHFGNTKFPKSFNFFNPIVTMIWFSILSSLLPDPIGFYVTGCLGSFTLLLFNLGSTYYLWSNNHDSSGALESLANNLLLPKNNGGKVAPIAPTITDYKSVQN